MEVNYIDVINKFWLLRRSRRITSLQSDLYFFLLNESNSRGDGRDWENPLECANGLVCSSIGCSENSLADARNVLQQLGLISVTRGVTKTKSPTYYLNICGNDRGNNRGNDRGNDRGNEANTIKGKTKRNKTKPISSGDKPPATKIELDFWKAFIEVWDKFYFEKLKNKYAYQQKDFGCLKKIYDFLKKRSEQKNWEFTEENLIKAFNVHLKSAYSKDEWLRQNFTIPNILSQFNQIENGTITRANTTGNIGVAGRQQSTVGSLLRDFGKDIANADLKEHSES